MNSLFSSFDPFTSKSLPMGLLLMTLTLILVPMNFWSHHSITLKLPNSIKKILHKTFLINTNSSLPPSSVILFPIFILIYIMNTQSLFPYTFPLSSHMIFSLSLSLPLWFAPTIHNILHSPQITLSHLTPQSTPTPLIPPMTMIELLSLLIQPLTLSLRLMANLTAGHLLLNLISMAMNPPIFLPIIITLTLLTFLELAISFIQAYIFTTLLTLYTNN
uniref:ATP synthase subunit a n=1 Tax=Armillifer agkistrodontis TaxID=592791 RepID=A0A1J0CYI4_ARMAG|nr:ATP synthase F0 subunit 6 [Armillifer agkistrodontis]APB92069.1 ATP synthase F0 subunit 6 [Armillifer agkistrodontis]